MPQDNRSTGSPVISAILFALLSVLYVVVLPIALLLRLTDPLRARLGDRDSYWEDHPPHEPSLERMKRQY